MQEGGGYKCYEQRPGEGKDAAQMSRYTATILQNEHKTAIVRTELGVNTNYLL